MVDEQRDGVVVVKVLPDSVPELTEKFQLVLKSVEGGAEIDHTHNTSSFDIRLVLICRGRGRDRPHPQHVIIWYKVCIDL